MNVFGSLEQGEDLPFCPTMIGFQVSVKYAGARVSFCYVSMQSLNYFIIDFFVKFSGK